MWVFCNAVSGVCLCLFVSKQQCIYSCTSFFNSFVSSDKHTTHNTRDITNWKTTLDTQITERDIERERERYTRNTHVVGLLQLLFCFFCCVFLRANEDDVVERRTTTTSKEDENDEVDEQENGKDTSLKLRDDD